MEHTITALRGGLLTYTDDPFLKEMDQCLVFTDDAIILIQDGEILDFGSAEEMRTQIPDGVEIIHYKDCIISAGFIDTHVHYSQTQIIAAFGEQLIDWLNTYTFVAEQQFVDKDHARQVAKLFLQECLRHGTTTASVYCTVFPQSVDAFFEESQKINMRNIAGKVMMDRHAPSALTETVQQSYDNTTDLIETWHGNGRQLYAVTPRFAPTSSPEQMEIAGKIWHEHPGTYLQSHLSENKDEIEWVKALYPECTGYLDVYDRFDQLGPRAIYGHGIYLSNDELERCYATGTAIAFCPTSNLFLGSGLFDIAHTKKVDRPVRVGLATDLGAGTSFSMLQTMGEAYKVSQLCGFPLSAGHAFYLATRGAAQALYLDDKIGSISHGMEADLVVLDLNATDLLKYRMDYCNDIYERLFVLMTLGDDRATRATYVNGNLVYEKTDQ